MNGTMTNRAERDQVVFIVGSEVTAKLLVVNLEVGHAAAGLTAPAIALKYLASQLRVRSWIQAQANLLGSNGHATFSAMAARKLCF